MACCLKARLHIPRQKARSERSRVDSAGDLDASKFKSTTGSILESLPESKQREMALEITKRNETHSPLLRLPAELRNHIYEYVLGGKSICLSSRGSKAVGEICALLATPSTGYCSDDRQYGVLQLLKVCRQINVEARALPFTLNAFRYSNILQNLEVWRRDKPESMSLITTVRLYSTGCSNEANWIEGLKYFPNLKCVEVAINQARSFRLAQSGEDESARQQEWERGVEGLVWKTTKSSPKVVFYRHTY